MELDVRPIPPAHKHATIFEMFNGLTPREHLILINDHDPVPLRGQFDVNFARSFTWEYDEAGPEVWRIRITKTAHSPLPQVLTNTATLAGSEKTPDLTGAIWKIPIAERDLDANVIALGPDTRIASHAGPDIDVMFLIIAGDGRITTEVDEVSVVPGDLVWLPKRSTRAVRAGKDGLRYLTTHVHKTGLAITSV